MTTMFDQLSTLNNNLVLGFLGDYGHRPFVFAKKIEGFIPCLNDMLSYFFATENEVLFVCIDVMPFKTQELAHEKPCGDDEPMYFTSKSHRVSPVWQLSQAMSLFSQCLDNAGVASPVIRGVLLTTSRILNEDEMAATWHRMGIKVFHSMLPHARYGFSVETREELPMAQWYKMLGDYALHHLLQKMIDDDNHGIIDDEGVGEKDNSFDDPFAGEFEDEAWLHDEDEDDDEEGDDLEDLDLPKPEFLLGGNNKVKVEVLKPLANPRKELDRMVGCTDIRKQLDDLLALNRYNQLMLHLNPKGKMHEMALHGIFLGRPGTGKTTLCKIYGSLLREAGMLSKGHVVCCHRGTFIGSNWGDEETAMRSVIELARGGVLMIDEAYLLNSGHPNDPGKMVIPLLMDILADEDMRDIAIILCGYKEEMLRLIDLNPGLDSRFPNRFEFPDFSIDDLLEITRRRIKGYGYRFTPLAWRKYRGIVSSAYEARDPKNWGNARYVANLLEHIYLCHARRCVQLRNPDRQHMLSITAADIQPIAPPQKKKRVGF